MQTNLPIGLSIACLVLGFAYAFFLYRKQRTEKQPWLLVMAVFRFLSVALLSFFLLEPYWRSIEEQQAKPIILLGVDNSSSIAEADSLVEVVHTLSEAWTEKYDLKTYLFGQEVQEYSTPDHSDKKTDMSALLKYWSDVYSQQHVAAAVIASDGLYNTGSNPLYSAFPFQAPLHTIALGDTSLQQDMKINKVFHNKMAYLGNRFPLYLSIQAVGGKGEQTTLRVRQGARVLHEESIQLEKENQLLQKELFLSADTVGMHQYSISLTPLSKEKNSANNRQEVFVEVLESRQQILLLSAAPHPDVAAIASAIQSNDNYELTHQLVDDFEGDLEPYDLLISYQTQLKANGIPSWYVWGEQNQYVDIGWVQFQAEAKGSTEMRPLWQPFSLFHLDETWAQWSTHLPPLQTAFGSISFSAPYQALFRQEVRGVELEDPLMAFSTSGVERSAVLFGEGIWRWKMQEYAQTKSHERFDELINKIVQFLAAKDDKRVFRLNCEKQLFEGDELQIEAELYNAAHELTNASEVNFYLRNEEGEEFHYVFNPYRSAYQLKLTELSVGQYSYIAKTTLAEKEYTYEGRFQVKPLQLEKLEDRANHQLLYTLSEQQEGKLYTILEIEALIAEVTDLDAKNIVYSSENLTELIHSKWIYYLLLAFLSLEWFLRKRNGIV
jgi:CRISPR/Cas system endoribonuclease Cas6 (RAMP superfamily)